MEPAEVQSFVHINTENKSFKQSMPTIKNANIQSRSLAQPYPSEFIEISLVNNDNTKQKIERPIDIRDSFDCRDASFNVDEEVEANDRHALPSAKSNKAASPRSMNI